MEIFNNSKYTNWYYNIINKAKNIGFRQGYLERHHIIPRALGGTNELSNLVNLTAKEHFICHLLLIKMQINSKNKHKMICAFSAMRVANKHQKRITSRLFEALKIHISLARSYLTKGKKKPEGFGEKIRQIRIGKKATQETRNNISKNHQDVSGSNNPMYGVIRPPEWRKSHSERMKGILAGSKNGMYGKTHVGTSLEKISKRSNELWKDPIRKKEMLEKTRQTKLAKKLLVSTSLPV